MEIPKQLVDEIFNYLARRPYMEVAKLIAELAKIANENKEPDNVD